MKILTLICAMMFFFSFALQNALKGITYQPATEQAREMMVINLDEIEIVAAPLSEEAGLAVAVK